MQHFYVSCTKISLAVVINQRACRPNTWRRLRDDDWFVSFSRAVGPQLVVAAELGFLSRAGRTRGPRRVKQGGQPAAGRSDHVPVGKVCCERCEPVVLCSPVCPVACSLLPWRRRWGCSRTPKLWFVENLRKIHENVRKIPKNLRKLPKNRGRNAAQRCLVFKNWRPVCGTIS